MSPCTPAAVSVPAKITLIGMEFLTARFVAKVVGTIISVGLGLGPVSRMWTRMVYLDIAKASFWVARIFLLNEAIQN